MKIIFLTIILVTVGCVSDSTQEKTNQREVSWPSSRQIDKSLLSQLKYEIRRDLRKVNVPVLALKSVQAKSILTNPDFYSFNVEQSGILVHLMASRKPMLTGNILIGTRGPNEAIRTGQGFIARTDISQSATWDEFGASYYLEVQCKTLTDKRCQNPELIRHYLNQLVLIGGAAY
ncbi:MAG: hypothetical protein IT289_08435 [Oligoflexia bacterium]|nr:hypothetical protein [Oligoflexia bacterium]